MNWKISCNYECINIHCQNVNLDEYNGHFLQFGETAYAATHNYNYAKYNASKFYNDDAPLVYNGGSSVTSAGGYAAYTFNSSNNTYTLSGYTGYPTLGGSAYKLVYNSIQDYLNPGSATATYPMYTYMYVYIHTAGSQGVSQYSRDVYNNTFYYTQGAYITSIQAANNTYPDNGYNAGDGFWYIKGSLINQNPTISVTSPTQNGTLLIEQALKGGIA